MKTFKQFMEELNQSKTPKMYGKQTGKYDDFVRDQDQKAKENSLFKRMTGFKLPLDLVKKNTNNRVA
tara:strand:- start:1229 stop:1429 length:201 start_codon:yes stop_codon:yes gene_type:complete